MKVFAKCSQGRFKAEPEESFLGFVHFGPRLLKLCLCLLGFRTHALEEVEALRIVGIKGIHDVLFECKKMGCDSVYVNKDVDVNESFGSRRRKSRRPRWQLATGRCHCNFHSRTPREQLCLGPLADGLCSPPYGLVVLVVHVQLVGAPGRILGARDFARCAHDALGASPDQGQDACLVHLGSRHCLSLCVNNRKVSIASPSVRASHLLCTNRLNQFQLHFISIKSQISTNETSQSTLQSSLACLPKQWNASSRFDAEIRKHPP